MSQPNKDTHYVWCQKGYGDHLECKEEDNLISIRAMNDGLRPESLQIYLTTQSAHALGLWLIDAASHIKE